MSRRDFVLRWVPGILFGVSAAGAGGLWASREEERIRMDKLANEQAPQIKELLLDTLQSDRLDNLGLFIPPVQDDIIQMTLSRQEGLFSNDTEVRNRTRWQIAGNIFSVYYHNPDSYITGYDEYIKTGTSKRFFAFLDETVGKIDQGTIKSRGGAAQTNMWVEAYFRAEAFSIDFDASQYDGVYTSFNLFTMSSFVPLQHHSFLPGE
jgi:hypothetical protein